MSTNLIAWLNYKGLDWDKLSKKQKRTEVAEMVQYYKEHKPIALKPRLKYRSAA
jgi:hypothetical protein